jgi:hypothetical protein
VRKRIEYLKTDGSERIKCDIIKKKSERYWDDEIYHQRSAKKNRIMEEMKNVAETYKICESSETHTSQNISFSSSSVYRVYSSLSVILQRDSQDKSPAGQYLQLKTG